MRTTTVSPEDLRGVFSVSPLARSGDRARKIDFDQNESIVRHIANGGITRLLYGGNAFMYHVTLAEYEQILDWLTGFDDELWAIPSIGPSYGRAMDQAALLRKYNFPCVMMLPCADPRDPAGLELGYREVAEAANTKLILYLKDESNFGADKLAGLDSVARLVDAGICVGIKYAVVREDPGQDQYLEELLQRVDRKYVISGIGERPAVIHMRDWSLPGFTTGSGCIAPRLTQMLFEACVRQDYPTAEMLRSEFIALEDLRDQWSPAKVLHHATELAGIAITGAIPPYLSPLSTEQQTTILPVARALFERNLSALIT